MGATNEYNTATNVNYKGATTAASFNVQSGDETTGNNTILNGAAYKAWSPGGGRMLDH